MAENEVVVENEIPEEPVASEEVVENEVVVEAQPEELKKPSAGSKFWGGIKEGCRKFVVKLKRRPMNIAFFVLIVSTLVNLLSLGNISQLGLNTFYGVGIVGIAVFVSQLFSILVLMLFLNSFPKREKKPKLVMFILLFVFMAILMGVDLYLYITWTAKYAEDLARTVANANYFNQLNAYYFPAVNGILAHCILVGISALLTATYPLYGKLINKINTRKVVEATEIKEEIDTSAEV